MTVRAKIPVVWNGLGGLPGVSIFYSSTTNAVAAVAALTTFFNAVKGAFPNGVTWDLPSSGDTFEDTDGGLSGIWTGATGGQVTGTGGSGGYAAGVGARIQWNTGAIINRRRVRGSTFMVPLITAAYDSNGTIASSHLGTMTSAANALVTTDTLMVWHRPSPGGSDGALIDVVTGTVADKVSTLRSRRT